MHQFASAYRLGALLDALDACNGYGLGLGA